MFGYINGIDWLNAEAMKYWSWPANKKDTAREETHSLIFSGEYWGALKVDGFYERLLKDEDGNCFMIARSKNVMVKQQIKLNGCHRLILSLKHFLMELVSFRNVIFLATKVVKKLQAFLVV